MMRTTLPSCFAALLLAGLVGLGGGCGREPSSGYEGDDLSLGEVGPDDLKADGNWGAATTCKPVPDLPRLVKPRIIISLHGLTLRLVDEATGFEKVFPIGPGAINTNPSEATYGESLSFYPVIATGKQDFEITPSSITPCKIWWTDKATGQTSPVFAGLPFMSWYGPYAIHGPIENYRDPSGGTLTRGFVSHGCIRMEAQDVLELYARIKGVPRVPVHIQREPERTAEGRRVDVASPWIGAECTSDSECTFSGGFCKKNPYSQRGYCTARCTTYCADRRGYPTTFCVEDPDAPGKGMCVPKTSSANPDCRAYDHMIPASRSRLNQAGVRATVCMPGSPGWVGDHCFTMAECKTGNVCVGASGGTPGLCTQSCTRFCPDMPGWAETTCVEESELGGKSCVRQCTPASNASECPAGTTCEVRRWAADASKTRTVCVP